MFNRIQTLYLCLSIIISCLGLFKYPFYLQLNNHTNYNDNIITFLYLIIVLISSINLFLYNTRTIQIYFNIINIMINIIVLLFTNYIIVILNIYSVKIFINIIYPILSSILLIISNKYIKKDIILLNSISRIR